MAGHRRHVEAVVVEQPANAAPLPLVEGVQLGGVARDDGGLDPGEAEPGKVLQGRVDWKVGHAPGGVADLHQRMRWSMLTGTMSWTWLSCRAVGDCISSTAWRCSSSMLRQPVVARVALRICSTTGSFS